MSWCIVIGGHEFHEGDLTLADAQRALDVCGGPWADLHPLASPGHLAALMAAFVSSGKPQEAFDAALVAAAGTPQAEALEMVRSSPSAPD